MDWKETDQRLIRRGELILETQSLKNHGKELKKMNEGRPGPRYKLANSYVELLAAIRYLYQMPYRQLEGFTRTLHTLVPDLPQATTQDSGNASSDSTQTPTGASGNPPNPSQSPSTPTESRSTRPGDGWSGCTGRRAAT
jgi:hypothetical protein